MTNPMLAELDEVVRLKGYIKQSREHFDHAKSAALQFLINHHSTIADMAKRLEVAERAAYMAGYVQGCNDEACGELNLYELLEDAMRAADHAGYVIAATQEGEG